MKNPNMMVFGALLRCIYLAMKGFVILGEAWILFLPGTITAAEKSLGFDWFFSEKDEGHAVLNEGEALCFRHNFGRLQLENARLLSPDYDSYRCIVPSDPFKREINWRIDGQMHLKNPSFVLDEKTALKKARSHSIYVLMLSTGFFMLFSLGLILYLSSWMKDYLLYTIAIFSNYLTQIATFIPFEDYVFQSSVKGLSLIMPWISNVGPLLSTMIYFTLIFHLLNNRGIWVKRVLWGVFLLQFLKFLNSTYVFFFTTSAGLLKIQLFILNNSVSLYLVFSLVLLSYEWLKHRKKIALYLFPSYVSLGLGGVIYAQSLMSGVVPPDWAKMSFFMGSFGQALFFYLAIGFSIKEKDAIQNRALETWGAQLDEKVKAKTAEITSILESSPSAIVFYSSDGKVVSENQSAVQLFHADHDLCKDLDRLLVSAVNKEALTAVLGEDEISWMINEANFPPQGKMNGRYYLLNWGPVFLEGKIKGVTLTAVDVTETLSAQKKAEIAEEEAKLIQTILRIAPIQRQRLISDIRIFSNQLLSKSDHALLMRSAHTFKGNALSLGMTELGERIHKWESSELSSEEVLALCESLISIYERIFGEGDGKFIAKEKAMAAILQKNCEDFLIAEFYSTLNAIVKENPSAIAKDRLAQRLGKASPQLKVISGDLKLPPSQANALGTVLIHAIRNSIDHGLETPKEREQAGKSEEGTIVVEGVLECGFLKIKIYDDGRGLNLKKLKEKAQNPSLSDEEASELIFAPSLSTKDTLSDISGRGIGLDAAREAIRQENGTIVAKLGNVIVEGQRAFRLEISLPLS